MFPILFHVGNLEVRSYGVMVGLSFVLALWLGTKEAQRRGLDPSLVQDFALYALLGGLLGARIYFVLFSEPSYFVKNPLETIAVWRGGISVIGALLGGFLVALWYCRWKRISFWKFSDALAPGIALGQTVGQLACLLNGDSYGKPTNLPWAITYTDPRSFAPLNTPLHPIEIYEIVAYFLVFVAVWQTRAKYRVEGFAFLTYIFAYSIARFSVEFFRGNPANFAWGIPAAQVFSVALMLASLTGFYIFSKRYGKAT